MTFQSQNPVAETEALLLLAGVCFYGIGFAVCGTGWAIWHQRLKRIKAQRDQLLKQLNRGTNHRPLPEDFDRFGEIGRKR